jgi:hypothetical protein
MTSVKNEDLGGLLPQKVSFREGQPSAFLNCNFRLRLIKGEYSDGGACCLPPDV